MRSCLSESCLTEAPCGITLTRCDETGSFRQNVCSETDRNWSVHDVAVTSYHRSRILVSILFLFVTICIGISGFIYLYTLDRTRLLHVIITPWFGPRSASQSDFGASKCLHIHSMHCILTHSGSGQGLYISEYTWSIPESCLYQRIHT